MKIGLIRETKIPEDNRVALSPEQVYAMSMAFPTHSFAVQSSDIRAYHDEDYAKLGIEVKEDISDCDVLFGIKEPELATLMPDKHYFFFGHFAKMQEYNKPLLCALTERRVTFSDYEYLVDDGGHRVCAFGWWAGIVGVYYTLQCYGLRNGVFSLPKPDRHFTLEKLRGILSSVRLPAVKLLITGNGRVSSGAQYILDQIGAVRLERREYLSCERVAHLSYCVATTEDLVVHKNGMKYDREEFLQWPAHYASDFKKWAASTDILLSCHFWDSNAPVYLDYEDLSNAENRIRVIGDVTCDINGSIKSTVRPSTHSNPFYDYNPMSRKEELPFSSNNNISVMAVDTCPNALAMDASTYFGEMLIQNVIFPILEGHISDDPVIRRATILDRGQLTPAYKYLDTFL